MNTRCTSSLVLTLLSFVAAITTTASTDTQATDSQLANITLRLYNGTTIDEYESVLIGDATNLLNYMNTSKPTVLYIFGWTETPESTSIKTVFGAYLERQDHNMILLDWQEIAGELYPFAAASVSSVGLITAEALNKMVASGLNSTTLHVIGHSLGAQTAGYIGRNVNFTLPRITGLDPAGPGFYILITDLSFTDAKFVDVIHTDAGFYGIDESDGIINFWPNGGTRVQPGCPLISIPFSDDDFCSHHRSWYYYSESVRNETAFIGVECENNILFALGLCSSNAQVVMGYATPATSSGNYYLTTNSESPFGRGKNGIK